MTDHAPDVPQDDEYDVVVLGAGAGGMTAALVARLEGLRTLLVERSGTVGGTTARSSGTVWIPDNPEQRRHGVQDDAAAARTYLDALVGTRADPALREAFVAAGPRMLQYLADRTDVRFRSYLTSVDYRQDLPGAARGGRPLEPLPFDGRTLGKAFDRVGAPLPELMLFGGMMITRGEAARLLRLPKSVGCARHSARASSRAMPPTACASVAARAWSSATRSPRGSTGTSSTATFPSGSRPRPRGWSSKAAA